MSFSGPSSSCNFTPTKHSNPIVKKPELRYNDFGGNIGGPFIRNRAFFFFNYEGDRVVSGSSTSGETATPALIASVSNPQIAKELSLMPAPTSATSNPLVGMFVGKRDTISNDNLFLARADTFLGAHHFLARYNSTTQLQQIQQFRPNDNQDYPITVHHAALSDIWTIDSSKVNELRLGLDRNLVNRNVDTYFTDPTQSFLMITGFSIPIRPSRCSTFRPRLTVSSTTSRLSTASTRSPLVLTIATIPADAPRTRALAVPTRHLLMCKPTPLVSSQSVSVAPSTFSARR